MAGEIVGHCPKCGAPIYAGIPSGTEIPPNNFSCGCRFVLSPTPAATLCVHCFCINDTGGTRCCKCGESSPQHVWGNTCSNATEIV